MQVNGKDYPIYRVENIEKLFETTNQIRFCWKKSLTYGMMMLERLIVAWKLLLVDDYRGSY